MEASSRFAEIAVNGEKFVAKVSASGMYQDGDGVLPLPIPANAECNEIGNFRDIKRRVRLTRPAEYAEYSNFISRICSSANATEFDTTVAAWWAFSGGDYRGDGGVANGIKAIIEASIRSVARHDSEASALALVA
ncbi:MAG: hypothetical protein LBG78_07155 [Azoarcus sp.]|jgi:hypothetical protein|nr:hypothetical protein [Azoarcus sp.]